MIKRFTRAISSALLALGMFTTPGVQAAEDGDQVPDWYYPEWLAEAPYAPVFKVRDTENKYGRYADKIKTITLKDLIAYLEEKPEMAEHLAAVKAYREEFGV